MWRLTGLHALFLTTLHEFPVTTLQPVASSLRSLPQSMLISADTLQTLMRNAHATMSSDDERFFGFCYHGMKILLEALDENGAS